MNMLSKFLLALSLFITPPAVLAQRLPGAPAQGVNGTANPFAIPTAPTALQLTQNQALALHGTKLPRPGVYLLRPMNAQFCLEQFSPGASESPFLRLNICNPLVSAQQFAVMPTGLSNTYRTIRSVTEIDARNQLRQCATFARGVSIGVARVSMLDCEFGSSASPQTSPYMGTLDQQFWPKWSQGSFAYQIRSNEGQPQCWAMRGAGSDQGTDVIRWDCHESNDQQYDFIFIKPLSAAIEGTFLSPTGWQSTPDGARFRNLVAGVDIPGGEYFSFNTIDDNGEYCLKRCLSETQCKAFTWTHSQYDPPFDVSPQAAAPQPMCYLKSTINTPLFRGEHKLSKITSGIVRP